MASAKSRYRRCVHDLTQLQRIPQSCLGWTCAQRGQPYGFRLRARIAHPRHDRRPM